MRFKKKPSIWLLLIIFSIISCGIFSSLIFINTNNLIFVIENYKLIIIVCLFVFFVFYTFIHWLFLKKIFHNATKESTKFKTIIKKQTTNRDNYVFLYLLSELQKKGRFIDFLSEDLNTYEDVDIGMATRIIHENCKKVINRYVSIKNLITKAEGTIVELSSNFDFNTVDLTGKITGKPPFKGRVKHKGWKLNIKKIPKFNEINAEYQILYPAKVDIE